MGRKYAHFEPNEGDTDRDVLIKYFSERESDGKEPDSNNDTLHMENGSNSVPTSQDNGRLFSCYHPACDFHTDNKLDYENMIARHWQQKHTGVPLLYHTKTEIEKYGLNPQGKSWEI
jgi:hypothetical protein